MQNEQKNIIAEFCKQYKEIVAVYMFGSRAEKTHKSQSDVDLAVLLNNKIAAEFDLLDFIVSLEHMLELPVDAVVLNRAGEVLKFQVRLNGVLLYESDVRLRKDFEVKSRKYYEDFQYLHKCYTREVLYGGIDG